MVDSLAGTSIAPPVTTAQATRAAAPSGDGGDSNFAQVLHDARGRSAGRAQTPAPSNTPANALAKTPTASAGETQPVVEQGGATPAENWESSVSLGTSPAASASTTLSTTPASDEAVPSAAAIANVNPVDVPVQNVDRTDARSAVPQPAAAAAITPESKDSSSALAGRAEKSEAAKPQEKKRGPAAGDAGNLPQPAQVSPQTSSTAAVDAASAAPSAGRTNDRSAGPRAITAIRKSASVSAAEQAGFSGQSVEVPTESAQAGSPQLNQQTGVGIQPLNTAAPLKESAATVTPANTAAALRQPSSPIAPGTSKASQPTHAGKVALPSDGIGATYEAAASAAPSLSDNAVSAAAAPVALATPFAAALSRHVAAEPAALPGAQPLTNHATFRSSQLSSGIGSDLQANGSVPQPAGEVAARSSALEVGFHDANLGWLSVRASTDVTGSLHAAVGAKTPSALAAVDTMLPALGRFLQQENVAVHSVSASGAAIATAAPGFTSSSLANDSSGGAGSSAQQQGAGRDGSQRNHEGNAGTNAVQTSRAATRLTSASPTARYGQGERLSTVSVRI